MFFSVTPTTMHHPKELLFAFSFSFSFVNCLLDLALIESYFSEKSVKDAVIFGCFTRNEQILFARQFMWSTRKVSILNINRTDFEKPMQTKYGQIGVILNGDCSDIDSFLNKCGELKFFDVKHHWLIISSSKNEILTILDNVILNINVDLQVAFPINNISDETSLNNSWNVIDVYNAASEHGGVLNSTLIGNYSNEDGYNARFAEAKYWLRKNMTGVTFKTIIVLPVAFRGTLNEYLHNDDNRDVNTFNRFHSRLVHFCRDYYNFSMEIKVEKSWGYTYPNGSFDGMVGALERKLIDFGNSPLFVREDRGRVMEYGRLTWVLRAAFIFRNPKTPGSIEVFLRPLSTSIWLITAFFATLSIVILKLVTTFEKRKYHKHTETTWSVSVLVTLGAFCQQGSPNTPKMTCGRIVTLFIFLLSVLIYQFYSASIVSNLLMTPVTTIKSLKDLLESSLRVGCEDILYTKDFLQHTTDRVARELYLEKILSTKKPNQSNFLPPEEGLNLVDNGHYAFHVEVATAYPIIEQTFREKTVCELREVQLFRTQPMHANYQKHSPFRDMLDTCLQRLGESGVLKRELIHWHPRKPECIQKADSSTFNVGLDEFYPVLVILFVGIFSSLTLLIVERQVFAFTCSKKPAPPPILVVKQKEVHVFPFAN